MLHSLKIGIPLSVLLACAVVLADHPAGKSGAAPFEPRVLPASDEGELAIGQFRVPQGFKVELFAAEPRLANPVAFHIDERNRFYVVETYRFKGGVLDLREVMSWLDDDTAARTVADRVAMVRKHRGDEGVRALSIASDRLKLIEDRDGDGKADFDSVFTDGDSRIEDGVASGVLARNGDVYYANIPSLYLLNDKDGDGRAEIKTSLHYGYGVRYAYLGHDLHGLRFGPDGKLYFSVGDRGLHVEKSVDGNKVSNPDSGAVLRCNPDGSELEIVHVGLRNPQELAFDQYGNLFTGDNNCDGGDASRWVHVVEGGDSGWRIGYQHQEFPVSRGPWQFELLWVPNPQVPVFYRLPPIANIGVSGPSGLTFNPGTGLPRQHDNHFFLCDFRGGPGGSAVHELVNKPKGASFELAEDKEFISNILPTDAEFGYDGGLYVSDWTTGWDLPGKGRIYRVFDPETAKGTLIAETRRLMAEGMAKRSPQELAKLLGYADMRVRMEAQFELAGRGDQSMPVLAGVAKMSENQLARLHAVWGLGQLGRKDAAALKPVLPLLDDGDAEVRAQAAKVLGDGKVAEAFGALVRRLADDSDRVKFFAATSLGKLGDKQAFKPALEALRANGDKDAYLRHAGVMALVGANDPPALVVAATDGSPAVRMGVLLALRRLQSPEIAVFLEDADPNLVLEAARAINDVPINGAVPALAKVIESKSIDQNTALGQMVWMRALNANWRLGTPESAKALATFAARPDANEFLRVDAIRMLGQWEQVPGRDHIVGLWRPLEKRDPMVAHTAAAAVLGEILRTAPDSVRVAAAETAAKVGVNDPDIVLGLVADARLQPAVRAAALGALRGTKDARLADAVKHALADPDQAVRRQAILLLVDVPDGVGQLEQVLANGSIRDRQAAFAAVAASGDAAADQILASAMDDLLAGNRIAPEVTLDLLEAAAARKSPEVAAKVKRYESTRKPPELVPLASYRETLAGGDAALGRKIFNERADVSCLKCHSVAGQGGRAGPDLAGVGARQPREYLLESILLPNKQISPGFETITVRLKDNSTLAGVIKSETDREIQLDVPDKGVVTIDKSKVKARRGGMSAMPEGLDKTLSKQDLRNLVEFLATQ